MNESIIKYFSPLEGIWVRVFFSIIIFIYVFNMSHPILNQYDIKYNFHPDSANYIIERAFDPWKTYRTPGYPLICALFFSQEDCKILIKSLKNKKYTELFGKDRKIERVLSDNGLDRSFRSLVLLQRTVQAGAVSLFFFALCEFFPIIFALCALVFSFWLTPLANPYNILTEPASQASIFMCLACLFLYQSKRKFIWMYFAAILSLIAWCIRPVCLFMIGICIICCFFFFYNDHFRYRLQYCINLLILLLVPSVYIAYLSIPVGGLVASTVQDQTDLGRALFFLEREDLENMPTERSKVFAQAFLDNYSKFVPEYEREFQTDLPDRYSSSHSLAYRYRYLSNPIIYVGSLYPYEVLRKDKKYPSTILERNKFVKELYKGVMSRHLSENIKLTLANFLSSFGYYDDLPVSQITRKLSYKIYILGLMLLIGVILFSRRGRYPLILLSAVHLGNLAVCSTHHPETRYIWFTEIFMTLAISLALCILVQAAVLALIQFYTKKKEVALQ